MQFALSVALASGVYLLLGSALLRRFHPRAAFALPFTSIYCAQMVLWFASYVVLPVNAGLEAVVGASFPIGIFVWAFAIMAFAIERRRSIASTGPVVTPNTGLLITLAGVAATLKVALVYSSQSHLGALGLDTHQHLYWTRQILDANHVPLVERGTEILSLYPKAFHVMTALWTATGVFGPSGPWLKLMPFLQAFLPCIVFAELLWVRLTKDCEAGNARPLLAFALAASLLVIAFGASRMVYPNYDLGGTPRFASGAALFAPYLLFLGGVSLESNQLRRLAWLSLPGTAVLLLAMNAILVAQLLVFVVPLLLVAHWFIGAGENESPNPISGIVIAIAIGLPIAIAATDPWIVAQWTAQLGDAGDAFLGLFGALSPERAATLGLIATDELVAEPPAAVRHASIVDIAALFVASLYRGATGLLVTGWSFPFLGELASEFGRVMLRVATLAFAAAAIFWTTRPQDRDDKRGNPWAAKLMAGLAIGCIFGGFAQNATFEFTKGLAIGRSYAFELLRDYCEIAPGHVGLVAETLVLLAAIGWAAQMAPRNEALSKSLTRPTSKGLLAVVIAALPFALYGVTETVEPDKSFWAPVHAEDLADLREIESHIGEDERVMAPSNTWGIGVESWIIPQGPTAGLLPFVTKPLVFNSRLGTSVYFNWKDLANFCRGTKEHRADFLARNNVRWFLLKGEGSGKESYYRKVRMCKLHLAAIGVTYPPAFTSGDVSLYPVEPGRVKASVRERTAAGSSS